VSKKRRRKKKAEAQRQRSSTRLDGQVICVTRQYIGNGQRQDVRIGIARGFSVATGVGAAITVTPAPATEQVEPPSALDRLMTMHARGLEGVLSELQQPTTAAWFLRVAERVFGRAKTERVFGQIVSDMRTEIHTALSEGRRLGAVVVWVRGYYAIIQASGLVSLFKLLGRTYALFKGLPL
jgi:hypothetical protein